MSREKPTKEERRKLKEAAKQLNAKLRLERKLASKMRKFLKRQANDFYRKWEDNRGLLDAFDSIEELSDILEDHYINTANKFSPYIVDQINTAMRNNGEEPINKDDPGLLLALLLFMQSSVRESAVKISETSNKEISASMREFEGDATKARKKQRARALPRSETIAATETQKAAEGSKAATLEAGQDIARAGAIAAIVFQSVKTWFTRQDGKVRPAHDAALFQEVRSEETFLVGGQELLYPGDTSFGASMWNIINCRCVAIYSMVII